MVKYLMKNLKARQLSTVIVSEKPPFSWLAQETNLLKLPAVTWSIIKAGALPEDICLWFCPQVKRSNEMGNQQSQFPQIIQFLLAYQ